MSGALRYQDPELQDLLAANYVAGTLRGPARKRMQTLIQQDPALAKQVRQWEAKLQPLHQATPEVEPKKSTWKQISNAISGATDPLVASLMKRLRFYRYLSGAALSAALLAGVMLWMPATDPVATPTGINYVAVMNNAGEQPTMVVTLVKSGRQMTVDILQKPSIETQQSLQLWAISKEDGSIASLGNVQLEKQIKTTLTKEQWGLIASAESLLLTAENASGAQAPSNQIIAKGLCVKVEGWKS